MELIITSEGTVRCLYDEAIDLSLLGQPHIMRASHVEPDAHGAWWADMAPVDGPKLGPYVKRSEALGAERTWIEAHFLD